MPSPSPKRSPANQKKLSNSLHLGREIFRDSFPPGLGNRTEMKLIFEYRLANGIRSVPDNRSNSDPVIDSWTPKRSWASGFNSKRKCGSSASFWTIVPTTRSQSSPRSRRDGSRRGTASASPVRRARASRYSSPSLDATTNGCSRVVRIRRPSRVSTSTSGSVARRRQRCVTWANPSFPDRGSREAVQRDSDRTSRTSAPQSFGVAGWSESRSQRSPIFVQLPSIQTRELTETHFPWSMWAAVPMLRMRSFRWTRAWALLMLSSLRPMMPPSGERSRDDVAVGGA